MTGAEMIAAERTRQVEVEGYTPGHDVTENDLLQLPMAAWCYLGDLLTDGLDFTAEEHLDPPDGWPWAPEFWRPTPEDDGWVAARTSRARRRAGVISAAMRAPALTSWRTCPRRVAGRHRPDCRRMRAVMLRPAAGQAGGRLATAPILRLTEAGLAATPLASRVALLCRAARACREAGIPIRERGAA